MEQVQDLFAFAHFLVVGQEEVRHDALGGDGYGSGGQAGKGWPDSVRCRTGPWAIVGAARQDSGHGHTDRFSDFPSMMQVGLPRAGTVVIFHRTRFGFAGRKFITCRFTAICRPPGRVEQVKAT